MTVHPVATGGNPPGWANPEDRLLAAFSALARAEREVAMLAVNIGAHRAEGRAEKLEEVLRVINTARLHLRAATRDWVDADEVQ